MSQGKENSVSVRREEGGMFKRLSKIFIDTDIAEIIQTEIEMSILRGEIKSGEKLPSLNEFIEIYEIGYQTSNKLQNIFRDNGLAESQTGKGVFFSFDQKNIEELKRKYEKKLQEEMDKADIYAGALKIDIKEFNKYMQHRISLKGFQGKKIFEIFKDIDKVSAIQTDIELAILRGEIQSGEKFPKLVELKENYDIGYQTSTKIHKVFKNNGLAENIPGKGTFFTFSATAINKLKENYQIKLIATLNKANVYIKSLSYC